MLFSDKVKIHNAAYTSEPELIKNDLLTPSKQDNFSIKNDLITPFKHDNFGNNILIAPSTHELEEDT